MNVKRKDPFWSSFVEFSKSVLKHQDRHPGRTDRLHAMMCPSSNLYLGMSARPCSSYTFRVKYILLSCTVQCKCISFCRPLLRYQLHIFAVYHRPRQLSRRRPVPAVHWLFFLVWIWRRTISAWGGLSVNTWSFSESSWPLCYSHCLRRLHSWRQCSFILFGTCGTLLSAPLNFGRGGTVAGDGNHFKRRSRAVFDDHSAYAAVDYPIQTDIQETSFFILDPFLCHSLSLCFSFLVQVTCYGYK